MLSLLDRYFLRQMVQTISATTIVLLAIISGTTFAQVLKQVANGRFPLSAMFQVMVFNILEQMSTILLLAGFIGVLLALGRMHRESEMHVLAASGMGPSGLLRPLAWLALPLVCMVGMLSLWLGPWAVARSIRVVVDASRSMVATGLEAGRFTELPGNHGIILVNSLNRDGSQFGRTFIAIDQTGSSGVHQIRLITSARGRLYQGSHGQHHYLSLEDGWQYEIPLHADNWRRVHYQRNDTSLLGSVSNKMTHSVHGMDTLTLMHTSGRDARAELAWRMIMPVMALVLMVLALSIAHQNPRESRFGRMFLALLSFYAYYLILSLCRGQIAQGHWHHATSLWGVSVCLLILATGLFYRPYVARKPHRGRPR